jgi:hypothetical protein
MARAKAKSKMRPARSLPVMTIALVALLLLAAPLPAFSQSCALCYTQAASAGHRMIEALRSGILILIVPPTFMSVCMIFIMRHKHNQFRDDEAGTDAASDYPNREW